MSWLRSGCAGFRQNMPGLWIRISTTKGIHKMDRSGGHFNIAHPNNKNYSCYIKISNSTRLLSKMKVLGFSDATL